MRTLSFVSACLLICVCSAGLKTDYNMLGSIVTVKDTLNFTYKNKSYTLLNESLPSEYVESENCDQTDQVLTELALHYLDSISEEQKKFVQGFSDNGGHWGQRYLYHLRELFFDEEQIGMKIYSDSSGVINLIELWNKSDSQMTIEFYCYQNNSLISVEVLKDQEQRDSWEMATHQVNKQRTLFGCNRLVWTNSPDSIAMRTGPSKTLEISGSLLNIAYTILGLLKCSVTDAFYENGIEGFQNYVSSKYVWLEYKKHAEKAVVDFEFIIEIDTGGSCKVMEELVKSNSGDTTSIEFVRKSIVETINNSKWFPSTENCVNRKSRKRLVVHYEYSTGIKVNAIQDL